MSSLIRGGRYRLWDFEKLEGRVLFATDFVLDWNAVALQTVADDHSPLIVPRAEQGGPTRTARALAIVHAAIFDAVNSIDQSYEPYLVSLRAPKFTSMGAAVATAAHDTLAALYPRQKADFDAALKTSLDQVPNGVGEKLGIAVGKYVASQVLRARRRDGSDAPVSYSEPVEPGVFQTFPGEPAPLGPGWGKVTPFTMKRGSQFRSAPPPALNSAAYAAAYNEVKAYGGDGVTTPTLRTAEQTEIGIYWAYDGTPGMGTPPRLYNQIAREIADQEGNTQVENARMFALVNLAMADAGIASWDTKYTYDLWRPIRGVRQVHHDGTPLDEGNPATVADPNWTPLAAPYTNSPTGSNNFTPPFPAYTSGHATFGAALFQTLTRFYGSDDIAFTFMSDEFNGVSWGVDGVIRPARPRSFTSFSQASEENGQSRIYLGIHWGFDKTAGIKQGNAIANNAFNNFLEPVRSKHGKRGWEGGDVIRVTLPATNFSGDDAEDDAANEDERSAARDVL
jgi:hypothetical protein